MTLRVLHILDHSVPLHSGYAFRTLAILTEQRRLGWETVQLTSSKHSLWSGVATDEETVDGFHFFRTQVPQGGWRTAPLLNQWAVIKDTRRRIEQVVEKTRPDVLHAHSPCLNGIAALQVGRRLRLPVVYEMRASWEDAAVDHGTTTEGSFRYRLARSLETWTLRRANAVTTICEGLRSDILARGVPDERVTVIPNAVDPGAFPLIESPDRELRTALGLDDALTLGFLGSFYAYEGLDTLLDAMPMILEFEPRARLLLVGGGFEESRLKEQAARLRLGESVIFAGRVPHDQVGRYYSCVDLLVYPRKSMRLTEMVTPLKPLEAMALGRLLVASDVGGHRELVADGVTGYLFKANSPEALVASVRRVLDERTRWNEVRAAGRRFIESDRNWQASTRGYEAVYEAARRAVATS
jgi:PEP-CTERM/exosortase A-associated glycosyltransferase